MDDKEKVLQVLYEFEEGGLISKDPKRVLLCVSDAIIGIGIGEQGFVTSKENIVEVIKNGMKEDADFVHSIDYGRVEVLMPVNNMAVVCAEVIVKAKGPDTVIKSSFSQSLTMIKEGESWKICCLHASAPIVTEENIEAYPLRFADKTLQSLKEKIGEEVYITEEQYRLAVLIDTIAFYIVNFTKDQYEKSQLNTDLCAYAKPGTPYEDFIKENLSDYVVEEDRERYMKVFSLDNILRAYEDNEKEVQFEYRMLTNDDNSYIWVVTVVRFITDIVTGDKKGIMYVKNIDSGKRQNIDMKVRAEYDAMLKMYNRATFISRIEELLKQGEGVFLMLDIDDFKVINDTCGHPAGDKALIYMAESLKETFPGQAVLGRLGGDEFGVYIPGMLNRNKVCGYLEQLFQNVAGYMPNEGQNMPISCSVGIAFVKNRSNFKEIYKDADVALYRVKQNGKGCFCFYADIDQEEF